MINGMMRRWMTRSRLDEIPGRISMRHGFLISTIVITVIGLSACGNTFIPTSPVDLITPSVTSKPVATSAATLTLESTPTVEVTEPMLIEWDSVELEIAGKPVEFAIGKEEGVDLWAKWGIEGLEINKNLPNYKERFAIKISASFWQAYLSQSMSEVSYEEFMQNPEKYKINLVSPDGEGGFKSEFFTMDQINRIEMRYINREDSRLYYENRLLSYINRGYKIQEDGTLMIYTTFQESDNNLDQIFRSDNALILGESTPYVVGLFLNDPIIYDITGIAYSINLGSPEPMPDYREDYLERTGLIKDMCNYPSGERIDAAPGGIPEKYVKFAPENSFWKAIFK